jgi:uncharacterized pyridoxal phosphate-containing UPF0001 family protein
MNMQTRVWVSVKNQKAGFQLKEKDGDLRECLSATSADRNGIMCWGVATFDAGRSVHSRDKEKLIQRCMQEEFKEFGAMLK